MNHISSTFFDNINNLSTIISLPSGFSSSFEHLNVNYISPLFFISFALILVLLLYKRINSSINHEKIKNDENEPPIIQKNTQFVDIRNKRLRIIHIIHELGAKVPLMLFIHGLGGQAAQWEAQIEYFASTANILAVDLVGCGKSEVSERLQDYTTESLVGDLTELLKRYPSDNTVLICHSYGCCLGTLLYQHVKQCIKALTLISVKAEVTEKNLERNRRLQLIPDIIFNILRAFDRRGGIHSASVNRMLHKNADDTIKLKQFLWNKQSKTRVFKSMLNEIKWFTKDDISAIECPLLLISGQEDKITQPSEMALIHKWINKSGVSPPPVIVQEAGHVPMFEKSELVNRTINYFHINDCGLATLDPAWQMIYTTKDENKWSMKNYEKWKKIPTISETPIDGTKFRAMKVMRQNDDEHCPAAFIARHPEIGL